MSHFHIIVEGIPPSKQTPADNRERDLQANRRRILREKARLHAGNRDPIKGKCWIKITCLRRRRGSDSANIIGGIADALEGFFYKNDRQLEEIKYNETRRKVNKYEITVSSVLQTGE